MEEIYIKYQIMLDKLNELMENLNIEEKEKKQNFDKINIINTPFLTLLILIYRKKFNNIEDIQDLVDALVNINRLELYFINEIKKNVDKYNELDRIFAGMQKITGKKNPSINEISIEMNKIYSDYINKLIEKLKSEFNINETFKNIIRERIGIIEKVISVFIDDSWEIYEDKLVSVECMQNKKRQSGQSTFRKEMILDKISGDPRYIVKLNKYEKKLLNELIAELNGEEFEFIRKYKLKRGKKTSNFLQNLEEM